MTNEKNIMDERFKKALKIPKKERTFKDFRDMHSGLDLKDGCIYDIGFNEIDSSKTRSVEIDCYLCDNKYKAFLKSYKHVSKVVTLCKDCADKLHKEILSEELNDQKRLKCK
jgi:hypothetical protein